MAEGSHYPSASSLEKAAIFYTAYTRDELPKATRPVTFIFNGGPGGGSAVLDLNFLGPKRIDWNAPQSATLPLVDNPNTLLDKTDLVFVDPVGTGYSKAVFPSRNDEFWSVDEDASVLTDFIIRYINANHRQESPKYIYGVSYGGIRVPVIGRMLIESGTAKYTDKKDSKNILTGLILNSPIFDYEADCLASYTSCGGSVPTYAMVADYHEKSTELIGRPIETFLAGVRPFVLKYNGYYYSSFSGVDQRLPDRSKWEAFLKQPEAPPFLNRLYQLTGLGKIYEPGDNASNNPWIAEPNMDSVEFGNLFDPGKGRLLLADGRRIIQPSDTDPAFDRNPDSNPIVGAYQMQFIGYRPALRYMQSNGEVIDNWDFWSHHANDPIKPDRAVSSIPDLANSLELKSDMKVLVQHGYYDLNTPFYQSVLVLAALPAGVTVPIKFYEGGHGIGPEDDTDPYVIVRHDLDEFYDQPRVGMLTAMRSPSLQRAQP
jgi:carboxypeptidase C (cathepsin A)